MAAGSMVILEEDFARFNTLLGKLCEESNAKFVFLVDKNGQQLSAVGQLDEVDPTAMASLAAGSVAATESLATLIGETEFTSLFHEGRNDNLHISLVAERFIVLVNFDERSSLGLVRLRVSQNTDELAAALTVLVERAASGNAGLELDDDLPEITAEDVEALFG
ncbi:MAG: roadblock/LC7 domain-containing protein [bacterium]|nr:roadblock/LC7 domain-containing protein [bacterium]